MRPAPRSGVLGRADMPAYLRVLRPWLAAHAACHPPWPLSGQAARLGVARPAFAASPPRTERQSLKSPLPSSLQLQPAEGAAPLLHFQPAPTLATSSKTAMRTTMRAAMV